MDRNEFMELVYETFADETDNVLANGIIEAADAYAEHEKAKLLMQGTTSDTISRQQEIDALDTAIEHYDGIAEECRKKANIERNDYMDMRDDAYEARQLAQWLNELKYLREKIEQLTIQPEPKEGHWIPHETPDGGEQYECSRCGVLWEFNDGTPEDNEAYFCPKCGTKMTTSTK